MIRFLMQYYTSVDAPLTEPTIPLLINAHAKPFADWYHGHGGHTWELGGSCLLYLSKRQ
jgi:hypothetical protein